MLISRLAGQPAQPAQLVDVRKLIDAYYSRRPDPSLAAERVRFGTSGHRGSSLDGAFNEAHVLAISQAICRYRRSRKIDGRPHPPAGGAAGGAAGESAPDRDPAR